MITFIHLKCVRMCSIYNYSKQFKYTIRKIRNMITILFNVQ